MEKQFPLSSDKKHNEMLRDNYKKKFQQHENIHAEILNPTPLPDEKIFDVVNINLKDLIMGKCFIENYLVDIFQL